MGLKNSSCAKIRPDKGGKNHLVVNENSIQKCTWKLTDQFSDVFTLKDMTIDKWADGFFWHENINHLITLQRDCGWAIHLEIHRCIYIQTPWNKPGWASKTLAQHEKKVESLFGEYCGFFCTTGLGDCEAVGREVWPRLTGNDGGGQGGGDHAGEGAGGSNSCGQGYVELRKNRSVWAWGLQ